MREHLNENEQADPATATDPFADVQQATREHRRYHGCEAYTFEDGPALLRLASGLRASRTLELGTALGYTACCLAHAHPQGHVDSVEGDAEHAALARAQIALHGLSTRIKVHTGSFGAVLPILTPGYGLVFFDGFAPSLDVIRQVHGLLNTGGVLVCSNLQLAHGAALVALQAELGDARRWKPRPHIEHGRTRVLEKVAG